MTMIQPSAIPSTVPSTTPTIWTKLDTSWKAADVLGLVKGADEREAEGRGRGAVEHQEQRAEASDEEVTGRVAGHKIGKEGLDVETCVVAGECLEED